MGRYIRRSEFIKKLSTSQTKFYEHLNKKFTRYDIPGIGLRYNEDEIDAYVKQFIVVERKPVYKNEVEETRELIKRLADRQRKGSGELKRC